ncbi:MAG TPA: hypothetical protein VFE61_00985 [Candidatus Sulfotelmatobacter sp.]|jgi:hypothetical protein|nr:hypothetical protein [Candidatus Sulfotelmatobacter sp.]
MRVRWTLILPAFGLVLFGLLTYKSIQFMHGFPNGGGRYFWWSGERLDSDPSGKRPQAPIKYSCEGGEENCLPFEPEYIWIDPGWLVRCLVLTALPAFLVGTGVVHGLARLGVSEVISFMVSMPLLIFAWFYLVGWLVDRRLPRRPA